MWGMPVRQPSAESRLRPVVAVAVALAALALVALAARSGRTQTLTPITVPSAAASPTDLPTPRVSEAPPPAPPRSADGWSLSNAVFAALLLLGVAALLAYAAWLLRRADTRWRWWQRSVPPEPVPDPGAGPAPDPAMTGALADAVDEGLRRLAEGPPQDAVIACWVLLERTAGEAGTARRPAETSAELTARVLREHHVSAAALGRLADLYREARYSSHPLGEDARALARDALAQVRSELAGTEAAR
jgi:Domain of unknown function (DUF4129)